MSDEEVRKLLPELGQQARQSLIRAIQTPGFDGTLDGDAVQSAASLDAKTIDEWMIQLLPLVAKFAKPAISGFEVGALLRGGSGRLYFGVNIEFPGQSLGATIHAEQCAAANACHHGEDALEALAVTAPPCGLCRQFLWELCSGGNLQVLTRNQPATLLSKLLPAAFGPADLGLEKGALPVSRRPLHLVMKREDELAEKAMTAAERSYAPYTKSASGVAVETAAGRIYSGSYLENAAFNPSLSPLQSAVGMLVVSGEHPHSIVRAILVETEGAIRHQQTALADLKALAPDAEFTALLAY